jgi:hypothetical protein
MNLVEGRHSLVLASTRTHRFEIHQLWFRYRICHPERSVLQRSRRTCFSESGRSALHRRGKPSLDISKQFITLELPRSLAAFIRKATIPCLGPYNLLCFFIFLIRIRHDRDLPSTSIQELSQGLHMTDFLVGLTFVAIILIPAILATVHKDDPNDDT